MCASVNSERSSRTSASSVPNSACASARASSVLPTPLGPTKRKPPTGLRGSLRPARARRTASETVRDGAVLADRRALRAALRAPSNPARCASVSVPCGMPVQRETTAATRSRVDRASTRRHRGGRRRLVHRRRSLCRAKSGRRCTAPPASRRLRSPSSPIVTLWCAAYFGAQAAQNRDRLLDRRLFDDRPAESAARAPRRIRCTCGTRRRSSRRCIAVRRARARV